MDFRNAWERISNSFLADFSDLHSLESTVQLLVRVSLALLLGGVLGWQREHAGKAAGVRTHMLVCLGAALFVFVPQSSGVNLDGVSRIIQGLMTGIGFVGAGAIIKSESPVRIHGLTTAAGIWLTAAIGVAVGMGHGMTAVVVTVVAFCVLWLIPGDHPPQSMPQDAPTKHDGGKK